MIQALHHIGLAVGNLEQSSGFLQHAFAFAHLSGPSLAIPTAARSALLPGQELTGSAWLRAPNCYLELLTFAQPIPNHPVWRPVNEAGITHCCVQAQQMATLYDRCAAAGARFHSAPVDLGTGWHYCYARDLEANVIELEAAPFAPPEQAPWLAHVALATANIERLAAFYHQVLGGARLGGQKIGPNPRFDQITGLQQVALIPTWIVGANLTLELWQFLTPPTILSPQPRAFTALGYNHVAFEVVDLPGTLASWLAAGATQVTPLWTGDGMSIVYVRDPEDNLLELLELSPASAHLAIDHLPDHAIVARVAALRQGGRSQG